MVTERKIEGENAKKRLDFWLIKTSVTFSAFANMEPVDGAVLQIERTL